MSSEKEMAEALGRIGRAFDIEDPRLLLLSPVAGDKSAAELLADHVEESLKELGREIRSLGKILASLALEDQS